MSEIDFRDHCPACGALLPESAFNGISAECDCGLDADAGAFGDLQELRHREAHMLMTLERICDVVDRHDTMAVDALHDIVEILSEPRHFDDQWRDGSDPAHAYQAACLRAKGST